MALVLAGAGVDRGTAAEMGEGRFAAEALRVVAGGDQQGPGAVDATPVRATSAGVVCSTIARTALSAVISSSKLWMRWARERSVNLVI